MIDFRIQNLASISKRYSSKNWHLIPQERFPDEIAELNENGPLLTKLDFVARSLRYFAIVEVGLQYNVLPWPLPPDDEQRFVSALRTVTMTQILENDPSLTLIASLRNRFEADHHSIIPQQSPQPHIFMGFLSFVDFFNANEALRELIDELRRGQLRNQLLDDKSGDDLLNLLLNPANYRVYLSPLVDLLRFAENFCTLLDENSPAGEDNSMWSYFDPLFSRIRQEGTQQAIRVLFSIFYGLRFNARNPFDGLDRDQMLDSWAALISLINGRWTQLHLNFSKLALLSFARRYVRDSSVRQQSQRSTMNFPENSPG